MKERPILFSGPMIRAILDGKKTMTRRVISGRADLPYYNYYQDDNMVVHFYGERDPGIYVKNKFEGVKQLWVRETWAENKDASGDKRDILEDDYLYRADQNGYSPPIKWRPSIFMPRRASRITLEITNYHIEQIQLITETEAVSDIPYLLPGEETGEMPEVGESLLVWRFRRLWDSLNAKRGYAWTARPWVYAISFRVISP
jgi:hypothetical protein